jgi:hypothetical protein
MKPHDEIEVSFRVLATERRLARQELWLNLAEHNAQSSFAGSITPVRQKMVERLEAQLQRPTQYVELSW